MAVEIKGIRIHFYASRVFYRRHDNTETDVIFCAWLSAGQAGGFFAIAAPSEILASSENILKPPPYPKFPDVNVGSKRRGNRRE